MKKWKAAIAAAVMLLGVLLGVSSHSAQSVATHDVMIADGGSGATPTPTPTPDPDPDGGECNDSHCLN